MHKYLFSSYEYETCLLSESGHLSVRVVLAGPRRRGGGEDGAAAEFHWYLTYPGGVPSRRNSTCRQGPVKVPRLDGIGQLYETWSAFQYKAGSP